MNYWDLVELQPEFPQAPLVFEAAHLAEIKVVLLERVWLESILSIKVLSANEINAQ